MNSNLIPTTVSIPQQILFYPQNLPLFQHDYVKNWSNLIYFNSFKPSKDLVPEDAKSITGEQTKLAVGKDLIIVSGHQHSFRELLFPFVEEDGAKIGLRNGTCVMVGLFKERLEGQDIGDTQFISSVDEESNQKLYLDMRVVFTESYVPNRDKVMFMALYQKLILKKVN